MTQRAWTLGYPPAYEKAVRTPGNAKAPGGYAFPTREAAIEHAQTHLDAARYEPFEMELPGPYEECVTRDLETASRARHEWHQQPWMAECLVCNPDVSIGILDHDLLLIAAPLINPDTGLPA